MTVHLPWFEGDKEGLAELVERQGKAFIIFELLQNAFDEDDCTAVKVSFNPIEGRRGVCTLEVDDNSPEGFKDLSHAYTLFAKSYKKADPTKRGRFNLGEKLVLAICESAKVISTKGTVIFDEKGRTKSSKKTTVGTKFSAVIKINRGEHAEICDEVGSVIIPEHIETTFNGIKLESRKPIHTFEASLPTEIADEEGRLKPTTRKTEIRIFEPTEEENPHIYEMGIPVVETDCKWHIDIQQKVPLNMQRDNVKPSYAKTLSVLVFNEMHERIAASEASNAWVRQATSDERISSKAFTNALDKRFGEKRVSRDPNDPESAMNAVTNGYNIVGGRSMNANEWQNAKRFEAIPASSSSNLGFATPKPYHKDGSPVEIIPPEKWSKGMHNIAEYYKTIGKALLDKQITVTIVKKLSNNCRACYGKGGRLELSLQGLGRKWFDQGPTVDVDELLIHEVGHEYSSNHLDAEYHRALCRLGAKLKQLAIRDPDLFNRFNMGDN